MQEFLVMAKKVTLFVLCHAHEKLSNSLNVMLILYDMAYLSDNCAHFMFV